ncbi:MAG: dihydrolipoamide acetyltransferase family protein [Armatimonadota bacterium]|nr:dihydrolipoamide acetyltransferase family protein [Armatimonadota bacterium]
MAEITMPKMSDAMEEGTLLKWLKHEGDSVEKGEPIAEIETDKATMQIESFESGVVKELKTKEGETVPVGSPIAVVEADGRGAVAAPPAEAQAPAAAAVPAEAPEEEARVEEKPPAPPEPPPAVPTPPPPAPPKVEEEERIKASPLAQKMAREEGLDLREIRGTGPGGRVVEADVREYTQKKAAALPVEERPAKLAAPLPAPAAPVAPAAGEVELGRIRKAVAKRMVQSKQTAPHFYVTSEVIMDRALELRESLNGARAEGEKIGATDMIVKACATALKRVPEINASWSEDKVLYHEHANVAIAVALDEGLVAPVVPECDMKSLSEIAAVSKELIGRARSGALKQEDLAGATFTVSNLGMFDVESFTAIIVPPECAILAVASIAPRPVVVEDAVRVARTMKITLSADHRITDGVGAARFLKEVKQLLESPFNLVE